VKVAVLGDTHLGRSLYGYDMTPHIRRVMYRFFRFCVQNKVRRAVHLGDLFDSPKPSTRLLKIAFQWVNEFSRAGIALDVLVGNHDCHANGAIASALEPLKVAGVPLVRVVDRPTYIPCEAWTGERGALMLPFPSSALYGLSGRWNDAIETCLDASLGLPFDLFCHLNITGALLGDQEWTYRGGDHCLPASLVERSNVRRVINGHIHKQQYLFDGSVFMPGAALRLRFGESLNPTVFCLLDAEEMTVEAVETLRLYHIKIDARSMTSTTEVLTEVKDQIADLSSKREGGIDGLVKVSPVVDDLSAISWGEVERCLYDEGADHVVIESPQWQTKSPAQESTTEQPRKTVNDTVKKWIVDNLEGREERREVYRKFLGLKRRAED